MWNKSNRMGWKLQLIPKKFLMPGNWLWNYFLSDHYADCEAPCKVACPNHVDVQSYVSLAANGQYKESLQVIKETLPMPLSIGRVCPAFCEEECRRKIVEEPIAIRQLKRHAADFDINDYEQFIPAKEAEKNKKIAIIGAGPSGLTCGYYLLIKDTM